MREQKPKYIVPDQTKKRVQNFMNEFMESQKLTKAGLARILEEKLYQELLSNYPYQRMDLKHRIVFFLLKYKCILLLKILFKSVKS